MAEINRDSRKQIDDIFDKVRRIDDSKAEIILLVSENIRAASSDITNMSSSIGSGRTLALAARTLYENVIRKFVH